MKRNIRLKKITGSHVVAFSDSRWVDKTITSCAKILAQQNLPGFCIETAKAIKELILFDEKNRLILTEQPLRIGMAIVENGHFIEVYNENFKTPCPYSKIKQQAELSNEKSIFFNNHSLDIFLYSDDTLLSILHADKIANGLSPNLINSIRCAYTSISATLNSLEMKMDMEKMQENVFINLAEIVEQKSTETGEHLKTVSAMVTILCDQLQIPEHEKHILSKASMVHDIGKMAIPEAILEKGGKLTPEEFSIMQDHVIYGYNIMSKSPGEFMSAAAVIAQQHHEKYDGTGYLEMRGEQIHLYARIVAIADVLDALLSERPYKPAWSPEKACAYINEQSGKHFDPFLVFAFNQCKNSLISVKMKPAAL